MQVPGYVLYDQDSPPGSIDLSKKYLAVFCFVSPRPIHFTLRKCLRELYARSFEKTGSCGPEFIWNLFHNVHFSSSSSSSFHFSFCSFFLIIICLFPFESFFFQKISSI